MSSLNAALAGVRDQLHTRDAAGGSGVSSARSTTSGAAAANVVEKASSRKEKSIASSSSHDDDDDGNVENSPILVFCRIRPSRGAGVTKQILSLDPDEKRVEFNIPRVVDPLAASGQPNNTKESFKFNFNGLFDQDTTQEQLFDGVGKRVVDSVIKGYNGTIFAYGQTGSGKTYSMMGGTDSFESRGLIPRSLSYIFEWITEHTSEYNVKLFCSYLEVYNDKGYDLLDPQHEHKSLEDLPRVTLLEQDGALHYRNLGELPAANVDEALNLLFVGDTNRVVCETPSNDASTRSHCIFMISLEIREIGGSKVRRSKLNLVDLAGSERVKKTGVGGKILNEALHINVSLHYLEQVIVALHDASNGRTTHIPYRNSMLTSVLRDSLGGSCLTTMIATLSPEKGHLDESISTSRFAQRVGMIKNRAELNEEVDPYVLVKQLKSQMKNMRDEITALRGEAKFRPLEDEEKLNIRSLISAFMKNDRDPQHFDEDGSGTYEQLAMPNPYRVRFAWQCWKEMAQNGAGSGGATVSSSIGASTVNHEELTRLRTENALLVESLRKTHGSSGGDSILAEIRATVTKGGVPAASTSASGASSRDREKESRSSSSASASRSNPSAVAPSQPPVVATPPPPTAAELALAKLRAESFESFRRSYRKHTMVEDQKSTHSKKVEEARMIGEEINALRNQINSTKANIEQYRLNRGVENLDASNGEPLPPDAEELRLRAVIDTCKHSYRSKFDHLKALKTEIDYLKNVIEQSRQQLQADFERWWQTQPQSQSASGGGIVPASAAPQDRNAPSQSRPSQSSSYPAPSSGGSRLISESASIAFAGAPSSSASRSQRAPPTEAWSTNSTAGPADPAAARQRHSQSASSNEAIPGGLRTTGNSAADADIAKFYAMKQEMLRQREQQQQR